MGSPSVDQLTVKIFADGADLKGMKEAAAQPHVKGFTTNPTLMRQAGVTDYKQFALDVLKLIPDRPVSFEVFADDFPTMEAQGREIASWGGNVYVKVPVTNTKGEFAGPLMTRLSSAGIKLNVTAIMTNEQVRRVAAALAKDVPAIVSVFAGRIADTGRDPVPIMREAVALLKERPIGRTSMGEPARAAQHLPGRRNRLPYHHRDRRGHPQAGAGRQGSRPLFARDGGDVLQGCVECRIHHSSRV